MVRVSHLGSTRSSGSTFFYTIEIEPLDVIDGCIYVVDPFFFILFFCWIIILHCIIIYFQIFYNMLYIIYEVYSFSLSYHVTCTVDDCAF